MLELEKNKTEKSIAVVMEEKKPVEQHVFLAEKEESILRKYSDLFPAALPALEKEGDDWVLQDEIIVAPQLQKLISKVCHQIILTKPDIVINEKAYGYPQKYLKEWKELLDEHEAAGKLGKSTSSYASPSMVISEKDRKEKPRGVCNFRKLNSVTEKN